MAKTRPRWQLWAILFSLILLFVISILNLSQRYVYDLSFSDTKGYVEIILGNSLEGSDDLGVVTGDTCVAIENTEVGTESDAAWFVKNFTESTMLTVQIERGNDILSATIPAYKKYCALYIILITLLGGFFICTGILLWWYASGAKTARSFSLLMTSIGVAFLLSDYINVYANPVIHYGYSFLWIASYTMVPSALLEFTQRFFKLKFIPVKGQITYYLFYIPSIILITILCITYYKWDKSYDFNWGQVWRHYFYDYVDAYLIISFTLYSILLITKLITSKNLSERQRLQWTLLTTAVGVLPFFIFYKVPIFLGYDPIVSLWICQSMMLIVPIGWGMSVASFRMFEVEWVLSRTIIYVIVSIIIVYVFSLFAAISTSYFENEGVMSLLIMVTIIITTIYVAIVGLISQVSKIVDKLYYHDYYNYHQEVQKITRILSNTTEKDKVLDLLTSKLPTILQIEKATLVTVSGSEELRVENSALHISNGEKEAIKAAIEDLIEAERDVETSLVQIESSNRQGSYGYGYVLMLGSDDQTSDVLMLGSKMSGAPFSMQDRRLLSSLSMQVSITLDNISMQQELIRTELIKRDLKSAERIMSLIVPQPDQLPAVDGVDLYGYSYPCHDIGGDYLDVIVTEDQRVAFIISDVSGKGLQASLLVSNLQATCQVLFHSGLPLTEIMHQINRILFHNSTPEQYVTCFVGILDPQRGELETVNAGHNDPCIVRNDGRIETLQQRDLILGIMEDIQFSSARAQLKPGDMIYLYTDGISEAFSPSGAEFGEARLMRILRESASSLTSEKLLKRIEQDVAQWCAVSNPEHGFPHDDFTQLCLRYQG